LSSEAITLLPKLKESVNKVKEKSIGKEIRGYEIAVQMKQKFSERAPPTIDSIKPMKDANLQNLVQFHNSLNSAIVSITKITSDNRYLFFFFNDEMKDFGRQMKELCRINDEIRAKIESKKDIFDAENGIISEISKYESLKSEHGSLSNLTNKLKHEVDEEGKKAENLVKDMGSLADSSNGLRDEIKRLELEIEGLNKELASFLYLLERPLKKYRRIVAEKWKINAVDELISNPVDAYIKFASGEKAFESVFDDLKAQMLKKGIVEDKKTLDKAIQAIDKLKQETMVNSAINLSDLHKELSLRQSKLKEFEDRERELKKDLLEFEKKQKEYNKHLHQGESIKKKIDETITEIESKSSGFIRKEVKFLD
jgi:predicted  nucleic acid-binding Zn-ribbon protein